MHILIGVEAEAHINFIHLKRQQFKNIYGKKNKAAKSCSILNAGKDKIDLSTATALQNNLVCKIQFYN